MSLKSHFFAPEKVKICRKESGLWLKMDGQKIELAEPRRALPLSSPDEYIVLTSKAGDELGIIRRLSELEPHSSAHLREQLENAYQVTTIVRILDVERDPISGQIHWQVEIEKEGDADPDEEAPPKRSEWHLLRRSARKRDIEKTFEEEEAGEVIESREMSFAIAGTEDIQTARYPQIFISDVDGKRYEIRDCEALDLTSRRVAEKYF